MTAIPAAPQVTPSDAVAAQTMLAPGGQSESAGHDPMHRGSGPLCGGNPRGTANLVAWSAGQIEKRCNDPMQQSVGPGPASGLDPVRPRPGGHAGPLRGGNPRGAANLAAWSGGQIAKSRNNPGLRRGRLPCNVGRWAARVRGGAGARRGPGTDGRDRPGHDGEGAGGGRRRRCAKTPCNVGRWVARARGGAGARRGPGADGRANRKSAQQPHATVCRTGACQWARPGGAAARWPRWSAAWRQPARRCQPGAAVGWANRKIAQQPHATVCRTGACQ